MPIMNKVRKTLGKQPQLPQKEKKKLRINFPNTLKASIMKTKILKKEIEEDTRRTSYVHG
jgi:hypothetical protein